MLMTNDVREQRGVRERVGEAEHPAELVTELVMDARARICERGAGEVGAFERVIAERATAQAVHDQGERFLRDRLRRAIAGVDPERFDRMREGVPQARGRGGARKADEPLRVVEDEGRADALVLAGALFDRPR